MRIQSTRDRILTIGDLGAKRMYSVGGAVAVPDWWDPNSVGLSVIGAWQAKGAASYAASLVDLSGNGNDLTEGNGAVTWAAGTGWSFTAAQAKYLDTGLTPQNGWSAFVQFASVPIDCYLFASVTNANARLGIRTNNGGGAKVTYLSGQVSDVFPTLQTGNLGVANQQGYRDGVADGAAIGAWADVSTFSLYVAARNAVGVADLFVTGYIRALVVYNGGAAAVAAQAVAIVAAMAAL